MKCKKCGEREAVCETDFCAGCLIEGKVFETLTVAQKIFVVQTANVQPPKPSDSFQRTRKEKGE